MIIHKNGTCPDFLPYILFGPRIREHEEERDDTWYLLVHDCMCHGLHWVANYESLLLALLTFSYVFFLEYSAAKC